MEYRYLELSGVIEIIPDVFEDLRGYFFEGFAREKLLEQTGYDFKVSQLNVSASKKGVIRGIHFTDISPGQGKIVQCIQGEIQDVVVDLNCESDKFKKYISVNLNCKEHNAIVIPAGFGHAFQALSDNAVVVYLCDQKYNPSVEKNINPLDPDLNIKWLLENQILSQRDRDGISLEQYLN